jgi:hypothetical protein
MAASTPALERPQLRKLTPFELENLNSGKAA